MRSKASADGRTWTEAKAKEVVKVKKKIENCMYSMSADRDEMGRRMQMQFLMRLALLAVEEEEEEEEEVTLKMVISYHH